MAVRPLSRDARTQLKRRRRARRRAVVAVVTIAAFGCIAVGVRTDPSPPDARVASVAAPTLRTPLWSARRVPAVFVDAIAAGRLNTQLAAVVAPVDACIAVETTSASLVRINPERPLAGASTQKLLVAAAALDVLGATHRFVTRAVTEAATRGNELTGDLVVIGGGDPVLTTIDDAAQPATHMADLADAIVRTGIRRIDGALVADDSRYDRTRAVADWTAGELAEGDVGALGALVENGGYGNGTNRAATDPALDAVSGLATLLAARGVQIVGGVRDPGTAAPANTREIARVESPPLTAIVEQMLRISNNETAELLTLEVGLAHSGTGSTAAGTQAIPAVLAGLGIPVAGIELHDGSGLAPPDRVTCDALVHVIDLSARPAFAAIERGLPVAGRTGTLALRFAGTPLAGRLRAKTGHINGVVGLAGVVTGGVTGANPHFAFMANGGFSTDEGSRLQDEIAAAIGAYPDAPTASELVPAPLPPV